MKTRILDFRIHLAAVVTVLLSSGISVAQQKGDEPLTVLDAEGVAYVDAKEEAEARILKAECKRAKLIFMEANARGTVLAYAIPQPKPAEIEAFMAPLKDFMATAQSPRSIGWAREQIKSLTMRFGFNEGTMRAVYILIPANKEELLKRVSFPAETVGECEEFIREDLKPVKLEIGKPYTARAGPRASVLDIKHGWDGEELVKDRGLEDALENWVDWHRKRKLLK